MVKPIPDGFRSVTPTIVVTVPKRQLNSTKRLLCK